MLNLACGFSAVLIMLEFSARWVVPVAAVLVCMGIVFDSFDGRLARKLGIQSKLGEYLDSFADFVTFGVAPAFMINHTGGGAIWLVLLLGASTLFYVCMGGFRLSRFNVSHPTDHFIGLPISIPALLIMAICLVWNLCKLSTGILFASVMVPLCVVFGVLMVSNITVKKL
jgi:CDP-diacylglycerol--serine O-phosphatidyltransferase